MQSSAPNPTSPSLVCSFSLHHSVSGSACTFSHSIGQEISAVTRSSMAPSRFRTTAAFVLAVIVHSHSTFAVPTAVASPCSSGPTQCCDSVQVRPSCQFVVDSGFPCLPYFYRISASFLHSLLLIICSLSTLPHELTPASSHVVASATNGGFGRSDDWISQCIVGRPQCSHWRKLVRYRTPTAQEGRPLFHPIFAALTRPLPIYTILLFQQSEHDREHQLRPDIVHFRTSVLLRNTTFNWYVQSAVYRILSPIRTLQYRLSQPRLFVVAGTLIGINCVTVNIS